MLGYTPERSAARATSVESSEYRVNIQLPKSGIGGPLVNGCKWKLSSVVLFNVC
jgi:hypothetical protein